MHHFKERRVIEILPVDLCWLLLLLSHVIMIMKDRVILRKGEIND